MLDRPELPTTAGSSQSPATLAFLGAPPLRSGRGNLDRTIGGISA
jgi:hypothetical protein